tara:strand:- start:7000 stop:7941 length:942 start_codon:yes stop_codon:yes gene_type:complete
MIKEVEQYFYILICVLILSCNRAGKVENGIGTQFDYRAGKFIITNYLDNVGSLLLIDERDLQVTQISSPDIGYDVLPRFSNDGSRVLFLRVLFNDHEQILEYNLNSKTTELIIDSVKFVTNLAYSSNDSSAYVILAKEFENYSPIAPKGLHKTDLYDINLQSQKLTKLSNLEAYSLHSLYIPNQGNKIFMTTFGAKTIDYNGITSFDIYQRKITPFQIANSPRSPVKDSFQLISLSEETAIYEAPYEIYEHNLEQNISKLILRTPDNSHFNTIKIDSTENKVTFSTSLGNFYHYFIDSDSLQQVKLNRILNGG